MNPSCLLRRFQYGSLFPLANFKTFPGQKSSDTPTSTVGMPADGAGGLLRETPAGGLFVVTRVLGQKSNTLLEEEERKFPVEFPTTSLQTDLFEITFPAGYHVDDLPPIDQISSPAEAAKGTQSQRARREVGAGGSRADHCVSG